MNKKTLARLYEWFSSIVLIFFLVVRFAFHDNDTLYTIVYILVVKKCQKQPRYRRLYKACRCHGTQISTTKKNISTIDENHS